jgi:epoxyqueuosine reductase
MVERIERGLLRGLDWFTVERARQSADPRRHLPEARSIVSLGMSYLGDGPNPLSPFPAGEGGTTSGGRTEDELPIALGGASSPPLPLGEGWGEGKPLRGRVARYAWGRDYHDVIGERLKLVAAWLVEHGQSDTRPKVFVDHGRMIDRAAAQRAGLGWYGKNTNILTRSHGSWVFLAEVLADVDLTPDEPLRATCGACRRCLDACPTGALVAPGVLDNDRCISYLTIELRGWIPRDLRPLVGTWIFGCDICQDVCPVNGKAQPGNHADYEGDRGIGPAPELVPLLALGEDEFRARFRGTPIYRTKRRGLVRNVAVALGNIGDPQAVPALVCALDDDDPIVRGHVAWALGRIGGDRAMSALAHRLEVEPDEEVREEIYLWL